MFLSDRGLISESYARRYYLRPELQVYFVDTSERISVLNLVMISNRKDNSKTRRLVLEREFGA